MNKFIPSLLISAVATTALIAPTLFTPVAANAAWSTTQFSTVKVGTWNINDWHLSPKGHSWGSRRTKVFSQIKSYAPDVMAVQEASQLNWKKNLPQWKDMQSSLFSAGYSLSNTGSRAKIGTTYGSSQGARIFYNRKKVTLINSGYLRQPKASGDAENLRKYSPWAIFQSKSTRAYFMVVDLHLTVGTKSKYVKTRQAQISHTLSSIKSINTKSYPVVIVGDFNENLYTSTGKKINTAIKSAGFTDMRNSKKASGTKNTTYNGYKKKETKSTHRIDYILYNGSKQSLSYTNIRKYPSKASDHNMQISSISVPWSTIKLR